MQCQQVITLPFYENFMEYKLLLTLLSHENFRRIEVGYYSSVP
jgi:hypothetical protein